MKRFELFRRTLIPQILAGFLVTFAVACISNQAAANGSDDANDPQASGERSEAFASLQEKGFREAMEGDFDNALTVLKKAASSEHDFASAAAGLISDHLSDIDAVRSAQKQEYRKAVRWVETALVADAYQPKLKEKELYEKLHDAVFDGIAAEFNKAETSESIRLAEPNAISDLRKKTIEAMDSSIEKADEAVGILEGDDSQFASLFRGAIKDYRKAVKEYEKAWESVKFQTAIERREAADELTGEEDDLSDSLGQIELLVMDKPWQVAITQAQLAKQLANGQRDVTKTDWYKSIVKAVQAKGAQAMREAEWYDAYRAWSGLKDLQPDSETYRTKAKTAARHVRVLQLYGQKEDPNVAADEDLTTWRDRVKGIDGRMVEGAISQVSRAYVTNVDYLSLTLGGLGSIKILAETPQAAESFPGLKNEKDKAKFIDSIDRAMAQFKNRTRMDNLCLQLAMNKVLLASEETVEIPTEVLAMEFTDGFLEELDQFSSMIWPYDVEEFNKQTMGKFVGVGIQITKSPGEPLRVVTPLVGSPAYKAGVKTDDVILKVDGVETTPLDINKLVRRITGKEGSIVTLTIKRQGLPKPIDIDIKREQIHIRTVKGWKRLDDGEWNYVLDPDWGIGYIRLTQFTRKSAEYMESALKDLRSKGINNLVLDLRFNPGGLLGSARDIASEFLDSGTVVSTSGRQTRKTVLSALTSGNFEEGKLIVLVNEYSASAAEIVSGALQDWKRATIVGSRTYGKGSVQHVIDLGDDRAFLKLTTAYYYLPSNRLLHRRPGAKTWGVDPDVSVYISPRQTRRWLDIRRTTDLVQDELDSSQLEKDLKEQLNADVQLKTALLLLKLQKLHDNQGVKTASSGS